MADGKATEKNTQNSDVTTIGVNKGSGKAFNAQNVPIPMSMPCIVILVHGVNDVGEAFQHQDRGICAGLNERLDRKDLTPHTWEDYIAQDVRNTIPSMVEDDQHLKTIGHSPIIPFYWGYRPVDKAVFLEDRQRYFDDLMAQYKTKFEAAQAVSEQDISRYPNILSPEVAVDLAYDAYVREESLLDQECNYSYTDQFFNYLDSNKIKNGGLFANATTCIPDMYGPGSNGLTMYIAKWKSRINFFNDGDYSHPIYDNCHRIYQVFAAQRLADLIIEIRRDNKTQNDAINIVAHSQGTIISMLANFMVKQRGLRPADCVIFNHSPYSLESRGLEDMLPGRQQTDYGRVETLANFCQLMRDNKAVCDYNAELLGKSAVLGKDHQWEKPEYSRNNFGKVYNYFCPNDQTVSLKPIQGFGWQGVPDDVMAKLGGNFRQRVFYKNAKVGVAEGVFSLPFKPGTASPSGSYPISNLQRETTALDKTSNADFGDRYRQINGEPLATPFEFSLMPETKPLGASDMALTMAAIARDDLVKAEYMQAVPDYITRLVNKGTYLTQDEIALINQHEYQGESVIRSAKRLNDGQLLIHRIKSREEIQHQTSSIISKVSQHSSIVVNEDVSKNAMAYDLAIGDCNAYTLNNGRFWLDLLKMADWRDKDNPRKEVREYYQTGILPTRIKEQMNHPNKKLPDGVVNDFGSGEQWPYPWPILK